MGALWYQQLDRRNPPVPHAWAAHVFSSTKTIFLPQNCLQFSNSLYNLCYVIQPYDLQSTSLKHTDVCPHGFNPALLMKGLVPPFYDSTQPCGEPV